jgi:hypothetical protein
METVIYNRNKFYDTGPRKLIFVLFHREIAPTSSALNFLMRMDVNASRLLATNRMHTRTQAVIAERPSTLGALPMTEVKRLI